MDALGRQIRLAEAAQRYYVDGWPQDRVAAHLRTSRSNVSRLLEDGPARGHGPLRHRSSRSAATKPSSRRWSAASASARRGSWPPTASTSSAGWRRAWLVEQDLDGRRLAIGWGRTIEAMVDRVLVDQPFDIEVVQVGGDLTMAPAPSGHELVRRLGDALGGRHRFLHAPALVGSEQVARQLLAEPRIAAELDLARRADVAVLGIGIPGVGFAERALAESIPDLDGAAAAVVCARLIDARGVELRDAAARPGDRHDHRRPDPGPDRGRRGRRRRQGPAHRRRPAQRRHRRHRLRPAGGGRRHRSQRANGARTRLHMPRRDPRTAEGAAASLANMWTIRRFEEAVEELFSRGLLHGTMHLSIGQESVAEGVCAAIDDGDFITSTHRGHGHTIAHGADLEAMMAELLMKDTGYCRGRGGSMHIADVKHGNLGANGIVAGSMTLAVGAALTQQLQGHRQGASSASSVTARPTRAPSTRR